MTIKALSWKPKRLGDLYCSPACGAGCTWADYRRTVALGRKIARQLGKMGDESEFGGWHHDVWENLKWCLAVESGCRRLRVYVHRFGRDRSKVTGYWAMLKDPGEAGGEWVGEDRKTPEAAVESVIRIAKAEVSKLNRIVGNL